MSIEVKPCPRDFASTHWRRSEERCAPRGRYDDAETWLGRAVELAEKEDQQIVAALIIAAGQRA